MKIDYTGRGFDITDRVREFTESKMDRLKRHLEDIHDISVILITEKHRQKAEIKFLSLKHVFHASEESGDMFNSIDCAMEKIEGQVKKLKDKNTSKKRNSHETIRTDNHLVEETADLVEAETEIRIIKNDASLIKPMNLEEAVEELTKLGNDFLVFRNSEEDQQLNVVYRRKDGHIGHVSPA